MGLRRWLLQTLAPPSQVSAPALDLLSGPTGHVELPALAGIDRGGASRPWSVARLEAILREAAVNPTSATLQAARQARHCLSVFWLSAPSDQLELLYCSAIGALQRLQLEGPWFIKSWRVTKRPGAISSSSSWTTPSKSRVIAICSWH